MTSAIEIDAARDGVRFIPTHKILAIKQASLGIPTGKHKLIPDQLFALDYGGSFRAFIQLVEGCDTRFVSPVALSNFAKKQLEAYPEKLLVYLKNAFHAGAYALTKG